MNATTEQTAALQAEAAETRREQQEIARRHELMRWRLAEQAAAENERLARDGWKLEAASRVKRAFQLFKAGVIDDAHAVLSEAIRVDPANVEGQALAVRVARQRGDNEGAREHFEKAVRLVGTAEYSDFVWYKLLAAVADDDCRREDGIALTQKLLNRFETLDAETLLLFVRSPLLSDSALQVARRVLDASDSDFDEVSAFGNPDVLIVLAANVMERGDLLGIAITWLRGAVWLAHTEAHVSSVVPPKLADARVEERLAFFADVATHVSELKQWLTDDALGKVTSALNDSYCGNKTYFYDLITARATAAAKAAPRQGVLFGCGAAVIAFLVLQTIGAVIASVISDRPTANIVGSIFSVIALAGAVVGGIASWKYAEQQHRARYDAEYYRTWNQLAEQQRAMDERFSCSSPLPA